MADREIVDGVLHQGTTDPVEHDQEDDDDDAYDMPPSASEALEKGLRWLETQDVEAIRILHLRNIVDFAKSHKASGIKQKTVLDFIKCTSTV